jgi:hypothetical protein
LYVFWLKLISGSPTAPSRTARRTAASSGTPRIVCMGTSAAPDFRAAWKSPSSVGRSIASGFSARTGSPRSRQARDQDGIRSHRAQTWTRSNRSESSIFPASS